MIAHFRRYQRIIYFVITVVIVISFSFFGTYSAFMKTSSGHDVTVAVLVDDTKLSRSQYMNWVRFLSVNPLALGEQGTGPLSGNAFQKVMLASPFGDELFTVIGQRASPGLVAKLDKEKNFQPYQHPKAPFLSAMNVWTYFSPNLKEQFLAFQRLPKDASGKEVYQAKKALYLAEREFPPVYLKQVLRYQGQQYSWVEQDPAFEGRNLSLFGYTSLEEWFGSEFFSSSILSIINGGKIAEKEGFQIPYEEAKLQLYANAKNFLEHYTAQPFKDDAEKMARSEELLKRCLAAYGMDEHEAVEIMKTILLFQRASIEAPSHLVTQGDPYRSLLSESLTTLSLRNYTLPEWLRGKKIFDIVQVQSWIDATSPQEARGADGLSLPQEFLAPSDVEKSFPELVQQRFSISIREVNKRALFATIPVKEMWNWLNGDDNWRRLAEKFPQLLTTAVQGVSYRQKAFEALPEAVKRQVGDFVRGELISSRSNWREEAFLSSKETMMTIALRPQGGLCPLPGIVDPNGLMELMKSAPLATLSDGLKAYSQDQEHYYSIIVLDRSELEIVPLKEAYHDKTLEKIVEGRLKAYYQKLQAARQGQQFQDTQGAYRHFEEVKDQLVRYAFADYFKKLDNLITVYTTKLPHYTAWNVEEDPFGGTLYARVRYLPYLLSVYTDVKEGKNALATPVADTSTSFQAEGKPLADAWSLEKEERKIERREVVAAGASSLSPLFSASAGTMTEPYYNDREGTAVFSVLESVEKADVDGPLFETLKAIAQFLGEEIVQVRSSQLLSKMQEKNALSLIETKQG